jgi:hypothetical protein
MPPPAKVKVTPHIFNLEEPIVTYDDRYEYIGEYRLTGYFPQEGEIMDCVGKNLVPGDVAISQDIPLQYGDRVVIEKVGVGIIEGTHTIKDKTAHWITGTVDVFVRNPYVASAITGTCYLWKIKGDR